MDTFESTYFVAERRRSSAPTELHGCTECQGVTRRCYCSLCLLLSGSVPDPTNVNSACLATLVYISCWRYTKED